jgi:condensin complex subunit 2
MELEFAIDPLFKKASADFDEGGAKGLLLNHLAIDGNGRIVFDSSDDAQDTADQDIDVTEGKAEPKPESPTVEIDLQALGAKFFPNLSIIDEQDICPSLKTFELGGADGALELPFLKAPEDWRQDSQPDSGSPAGDAGLGGFDDDDDILGGFDMANDVGFGDGGEAWAKEAALDPQMRVVNTIEGTNDSDNMDADGDGLEPGAKYAFSIARGDEQQNILDYFDKALQKNWAGPEHWKIRRVKDAAKAAAAGPAKRKEREPFEIDFMAPMSQSLADALYTPATTTSSITLPKTQWRSKTRNLLPDDKHFHSRQLLRLFLKPNAIVGTSGRRKQIPEERDIGEQYWANRNHEEEAAKNEADAQQANYDANFFQDDGFGMEPGLDEDDDVFADARDQLTPAMDGVEGQAVEGAAEPGQDGAFGEQLVTQSRRIRPEYVQYARVAKKVDVRRLKEEIWTKLAFEKVIASLHPRLANLPSLRSRQLPQPPQSFGHPTRRCSSATSSTSCRRCIRSR